MLAADAVIQLPGQRLASGALDRLLRRRRVPPRVPATGSWCGWGSPPPAPWPTCSPTCSPAASRSADALAAAHRHAGPPPAPGRQGPDRGGRQTPTWSCWATKRAAPPDVMARGRWHVRDAAGRSCAGRSSRPAGRADAMWRRHHVAPPPSPSLTTRDLMPSPKHRHAARPDRPHRRGRGQDGHARRAGPRGRRWPAAATPSIVVVPTASELADTGDRYADAVPASIGVGRVDVLAVTERAHARVPGRRRGRRAGDRHLHDRRQPAPVVDHPGRDAAGPGRPAGQRGAGCSWPGPRPAPPSSPST